jgi:hypothetical protein
VANSRWQLPPEPVIPKKCTPDGVRGIRHTSGVQFRIDTRSGGIAHSRETTG